jgi:formyl-CoA transferase
MLPEWEIAGYQRERTGTVLPNVSPSNVYPTRDGEMVIVAANMDTVFGRLTSVMKRDDLAVDSRYATHGARGANMEELDNLIAKWTAEFDAPSICLRIRILQLVRRLRGLIMRNSVEYRCKT